jgi:hypothetical protein
MEEVETRNVESVSGSASPEPNPGHPEPGHPASTDSAPGIQHSAPSEDPVASAAAEPAEPVPDSAAADAAEMERLRGELEEARTRWLEAYRRALLAENAGRVVPELVAGTNQQELERSVEVARSAFDAARAATLAEIAATPVPAGNPIRRGPDLESMSPMEKIAHGLKRE